MRPASIVNFERLYLGSLIVWVADKIVFWSVTQAAVLRNPQVAANPQLAGLLGPITLVVTLIYAGVSVALLYAVARRGSVAAKWIVVVTEAIGALFALGPLARLASGNATNTGDAVLSLVATVMAVAATVFLFRRDTVAWFNADRADEVGPLA